jgi:hypothetical protein
MTIYGSSYNPCPDGMSVATALMETMVYNSATDSSALKNITYLICDPSASNEIDLGLALGLGLGLGIPAFAILACLCYCMIFRDCIESSRRTSRIRHTIENVGKSASPITKMNNKNATDIIEPIKFIESYDILAPERHHHFVMDILDEEMKRDIEGLSNEQLRRLLGLAVSKYNMRNYIIGILNKRDYGMEFV